MNRILLFASTAMVAFLIAGCGPSAKELEEKRTADSTVVADSLAKRLGIANELNLSTRTPGDKQFIKTAETRFLVDNVRNASEKIEDLALKYTGYLIFSKLQNQESDYSRLEISRDSVLISKKIVVENQIVLRVPNEKLDSLCREMNRMILFLDYRFVKMDDISFTLLANQKSAERLKKYESRQKKNISLKGAKLKETTNAEETMLNHQVQADSLQVEALSLADQIKYCTFTVIIYQKPLYYHEKQPLLNTEPFRPGMLTRIVNAVTNGWIIFKMVIVFFFEIWWFFLLVAAIIAIYKFFKRPKK
jgi:hypothetical protein